MLAGTGEIKIYSANLRCIMLHMLLAMNVAATVSQRLSQKHMTKHIPAGFSRPAATLVKLHVLVSMYRAAQISLILHAYDFSFLISD